MARRPEDWQHLLRELRAEFLLREEELELLHSIDMRLLEEELYLDETLSFITDGTRALLRSEHVSILLKRGAVLEVTYSSDGLDIGKRIAIPGSIAGNCLIEGIPVFISDLPKSPLRHGYVPIVGHHGSPTRSLIEVPIVLRGSPIGVVCVESAKAAAFRPVHTRIMEAIAAQAAVALQNVQHFASAALFADVDQMIISQDDTQQVIQRVLQRVMDELHKLHHVELSGAQILFRKDDDELEILHSSNPADVGLVVSIHESVSGRAVTERRTVTVPNVMEDAQYVQLLGSAIRSEIAVPITLAADQVIIGVLNVESEELDAFSGFNEVVLESFAAKIRSLLAFVKLRNDVTVALESRHVNDLLVAIGDQTSNFIHRLNNSAGALRAKILELQETVDESAPDRDFLLAELADLLRLADRTLEMPAQVTRFLGQDGNTVDVNKCVADVLHELRPPVDIVVTTKFCDDLPELSVYSFDLVVQNLIKNAIDAMPNGGELTVSTKLFIHPDTPGGYVQMTVRNTGAGIPDDILPHIFDLNFTTKSKKKGKGLGLGLWWVRTFITRSNGEIAVETTKNMGTEFCVKIPVATNPMRGEVERFSE
ncbi:MAG: GAF domain-containing protein [Acidobacteriaceae bacterium]